jgi:GPH family glycoside/pentoside/hexuronide:cation symporter
MFVYDDFMRFSGFQKTIAHGGTMVGMALGAALSVSLARRFEKRGAVVFGGVFSVICNGVLALLFLTGFVSPHSPAALPLFVVFHAGYWFGSGVMLPISISMMADVSEIHLLNTGQNRDGMYSSVYSLAMRISIAFSLFASGYCLQLIGYQVRAGSQAVRQSPEAIWRLGFVTFVVGAAVGAVAPLAILRYRVSSIFLEKLRKMRKPNEEFPNHVDLVLTGQGHSLVSVTDE